MILFHPVILMRGLEASYASPAQRLRGPHIGWYYVRTTPI